MDILAVDSHVWYDNPLVVALVTVALTLVATHTGGIIERRLQTRREAKALRSGFIAEVSVIHHDLAHAAELCLQHRDRVVAYPRHLPTKFYEANVGRLHDLNDAPMAQLIVGLYSGLESLNQAAQVSREGDDDKWSEGTEPPPDPQDVYIDGLLDLDFKSCMLLCFLIDTHEYDDQFIQTVNEMLERASKEQGKPAGKMVRQGKKVLLSLHIERPERQWPRASAA